MRASGLGAVQVLRAPTGRRLEGALGWLVLAGLGAVLGVALGRQELPWYAVMGGGLGLVGTVTLALWRYDLAVALGLFLIGVVRFEPAPVDAVFAVVIAFAAVTGRLELRRMPLSMAGLCGAFIALNLLSTMDAVEAGRAFKYLTITIYLLAFGLWVCTYVDRVERSRMVVRIYVLVAVGFALASTLALFVRFPGSAELTTPDGERAKGLFKDPNVYGPFLVPAALLLIQESLRPRLLRLNRLVQLLCFTALGAGIVFSYSRAAWLDAALGIVVMLVVLTLRRGGSRRAMALTLVVLAAVAGLCATVVVTGSLGFLEQRAHFQAYDTQRFGAQRSGIELAERYPLGIGPGQFEVLSPVSAHSTYIRALAEEGIVGAAVLCALLFGTLILAARNAVLGRHTAEIGSTALLAAWCGIMANSVFIDTLHWRHLWLVAGLIWAGAMSSGWEVQASSSVLAGRGAER